LVVVIGHGLFVATIKKWPSGQFQLEPNFTKKKFQNSNLGEVP
jgi:hypothetical protein